MATVIFSNMGDEDTRVLKYIWAGMPKVKVVEITRDTVNSKALVDEAIANEHDTLIMCGHGTPGGLLNPGFKDGPYLVDQSNYRKIKCNRVIAVWCHAKDFAETYGVKGFWSSMFISNSGEAAANGIHSVSGRSITEQEILFCIRLNELIKNYVPMKTWIDRLKEQADYTNEVVKFNYDGLRYYRVAPTPKPSYRYSYGSIMKSESSRWGYDLTEDVFDDGIEYVEEDGGADAKGVVPYEPESFCGIRKTSLKDAEVIESGSVRNLYKRRKKPHLSKIESEIFAEDDYPSEIWGYQD